MWLMNIIGSIVVGILLEMGSNRDYYTPTIHIHDLTYDEDIITLTGAITVNNDNVSTRSRIDKYILLGKRLSENAIIRLDGDIEIKTLMDSLKTYYKKSMLKLCQNIKNKGER